MLTNRHGLGVGCIGGPLYAIGGHDGWSFLNTVERFDPVTCVWSYVASMTNARCTLGVAVLDNRCLFIRSTLIEIFFDYFFVKGFTLLVVEMVLQVFVKPNLMIHIPIVGHHVHQCKNVVEV